MPDQACTPSSALRPSQASAAELVAGGIQIAIPAKQPLGELTQAPVAEYAISAAPAQIDSDFIRQKNGMLIPIDIFFEGLPAAVS